MLGRGRENLTCFELDSSHNKMFTNLEKVQNQRFEEKFGDFVLLRKACNKTLQLEEKLHGRILEKISFIFESFFCKKLLTLVWRAKYSQ